MVIKNDALKRHLEKDIIADIRQHFCILATARINLTHRTAKRLKRREWEQNWHPYPTQEIQKLSSNYEAQEVLALLCESIAHNKAGAITLGKQIKGDHYIAQKCSKETIRGKYADHRQWQNIRIDKNGVCILMDKNRAISLAPNVIHSVDSTEELIEHLRVFFPILCSILETSNSDLAITILVKYAKYILRNTPPDSVHDINHHRRVWKNALCIMKNEGITDPNRIVFLCSFWHDINKHIFVADPSTLYLNMTNDEKIAGIIGDAINHHQWKSEPKSIYAKTLFDADKIEYISINRWQNAILKQPHNGNTKVYFEGLNARLPLLPTKLHSQTAKNMYFLRYKKFIKWAQDNNLYKNNKFKYKET